MIDQIQWDKMGGLVPAIIQDADTRQVLMLGYMNREALDLTKTSGQVTFFSRSKQRLWKKGESSGNSLEFCSVEIDCDGDALLVNAKPKGPSCHRGETSCFGKVDAPGLGFLARLDHVIDTRFKERPAGSYTTALFESGLDRIAQKVGEEAIETIIAAKNLESRSFRSEVADLLFHLLVLLKVCGVTLEEVIETLRARHQLR